MGCSIFSLHYLLLILYIGEITEGLIYSTFSSSYSSSGKPHRVNAKGSTVVYFHDKILKSTICLTTPKSEKSCEVVPFPRSDKKGRYASSKKNIFTV